MTIGLGEPIDVNDILLEHNSDGTHKSVSGVKYGLAAARPAVPSVGNVYITTDTTPKKFSYCAVAGTWTDLVGGTDEYSKVSANDSTSGYLNGKLVDGDNISLTEINDAGNETLSVGWKRQAFTNKSGATRAAGDVVIVDTANDVAINTTTTPGSTEKVLVIQTGGANNATVRCYYPGEIASVKVTGTVTRGDRLETSSTAGSAVSSGTYVTAATFAIALTADSGGYCTALIIDQEVNYPVLYETTLGADAASVDIQNIPQNYTDLEIIVRSRGAYAGSGPKMGLRLNNDSGSNYYDGTSTSAVTRAQVGPMGRSGAPAGMYTYSAIRISRYTSSMYKSINVISTGDGNGMASGVSGEAAGAHWMSSSAVNRVTLSGVSGDFKSGSIITIRGIK